MKILVINSGSTSLKYQLFNMPEQEVICSGLVERVGQEMGSIKYKTETESIQEDYTFPNHEVALQRVVHYLMDEKVGVITSTDDIEAVGHRVVHGGSTFADTTVVTEEVKAKIKELFSLAPQHNPANYEGIVVAEGIFPKAKQIAVFDTAFFQTLPEKAHKYAIPNKFYNDEKIRKYGFHGTSHKYVSQEAKTYLGQANSEKLITIHLGGGCSISAVQNGKAIETSLGFGPVTGLVMGSRSGDIDHTIIFHLVQNLGYSLEEVNHILQKESGMLGLTEEYIDFRDIEAEADKGNELCQKALELNAHRIKNFIGSYIASMNGVDAIVFTAGVGENSFVLRELVLKNLEYFGIEVDLEKNHVKARKIEEIQADSSGVKLLVIPTDEEAEIANQSFNLLK